MPSTPIQLFEPEKAADGEADATKRMSRSPKAGIFGEATEVQSLQRRVSWFTERHDDPPRNQGTILAWKPWDWPAINLRLSMLKSSTSRNRARLHSRKGFHRTPEPDDVHLPTRNKAIVIMDCT